LHANSRIGRVREEKEKAPSPKSGSLFAGGSR
jgi:hypothetical protein